MLSCGFVQADDWPNWRGPRRDGSTTENSRWDEHRWRETKQLWTKNVGIGSSSPLVVNKRVYTTGWRRGKDEIQCRDAGSGKLIWSQAYESPQYGRFSLGDKGLYGGPTGSMEFDPDGGLIYSLSVDGELRCWDPAAKGRQVWGLNLYEQYGVTKRPRYKRSGHRDYGYTSSPVVFKDWILVEVGSTDAMIVAFNKQTGDEVWRSAAVGPAGHTTGPQLMKVEGVDCIANLAFDGLYVIRIDAGHEGETVAVEPWSTNFANNVASPGIAGNRVYVTSAYNQNRLACFEMSLNGSKKVWEQQIASKVCSPLVHDGFVYLAYRGIHCLDAHSGKRIWSGKNTGDAGSILATGDDRLVVWSGRGRLELVETAQHSRTRKKTQWEKQLMNRHDVWPHVAMSDGCLFLKNRMGQLVCVSLR